MSDPIAEQGDALLEALDLLDGVDIALERVRDLCLRAGIAPPDDTLAARARAMHAAAELFAELKRRGFSLERTPKSGF
jgi:hypothetical protein